MCRNASWSHGILYRSQVISRLQLFGVEIEAKGRGCYHQAGEKHRPRCCQDICPARTDHRSPRRGRRLYAKAQKPQRRFGDYKSSHLYSYHDKPDSQAIWHYMDKKNPRITAADGLRCLHKREFFDCQHLPPYESGERCPAGRGQSDHRRVYARWQHD